MLELKLPDSPMGSYLQWKPVAYTKTDRAMENARHVSQPSLFVPVLWSVSPLCTGCLGAYSFFLPWSRGRWEAGRFGRMKYQASGLCNPAPRNEWKFTSSMCLITTQAFANCLAQTKMTCNAKCRVVAWRFKLIRICLRVSLPRRKIKLRLEH